MHLTRIGRRAAVALALVGAGVLALPSASGAIIEGGPVTLTGTVACDAATGHQVISWTLSNASASAVTLSTGFVSGAGMTVGEPLDIETELSPTHVVSGGTATGATQVSGNGVGTVTLTLNYAFDAVDPTLVGSVEVHGCEAPVTTPTTAASTATTASTPPQAAAGIRVATPHFTG